MNNQRQRYIDISVGIFMALGLFALLILVMKVSGLTTLVSQKGYSVTAEFTDIGGLRVRAPVTVAGVKIGEVTNIELQPGELNAKVTMRLRNDKPIPFEDASARILTEGLIGSNYVSIVPGFEDENHEHPYLRDGDVIAKTQEAVILENLIGQLLFNINKK
ncbi:outer membrane lipid asymmetry maintenance protein MlaD [Legionella jordanis]|uniref:Toluene transporter subunit: membrane component of ABC superfamily protein n=1 Tax=Legionella jordanis TaxID=456 RepID=A0A0W0V874_9GAMM|nr:outer membrane lipid asymmetry maintenance protein MlaD [Legionella jordanis]KTD16331.1 toluene transporter subunit: membrane component of ABC superfamily protein [Legionella jordanis]RMX04456.1 outer membrane lipid asymmetry maintenance protein MlaD [Legionella jordanis]RMX21001.1 outer membrane lipid asymmetry maintenance protein MlaD [Legionella jordanis]VEH12211.1 toluene transporter subunit: membrane component of ABC superfamily [Legionella jordanis]HAT8713421.1 outer membrane lipid as